MHEAPQFPLPLPGTVTGGPDKLAGPQGGHPVKLTGPKPPIDPSEIDFCEERRCKECGCLLLIGPGPICQACDNAEFWW